MDFATFRQQIGDQKMKGMFRNGWVMDYPSIENFLTPLYAHRCRVERHGLLQPGVRQAPRRGAAATDPAAANAKYQEAEALLAGRHADHPDVVRQGHLRLVREGHRRQDHGLRSDRLDVDLPEVTG